MGASKPCNSFIGPRSIDSKTFSPFTYLPQEGVVENVEIFPILKLTPTGIGFWFQKNFILKYVKYELVFNLH